MPPPGEIDASRGENTCKAVAAYRQMRGLGRGDQIDEALWRALAENDREPALTA
jgi:peptidoglycan hydrolase-like protein with peptidoglycan-binding domain